MSPKCICPLSHEFEPKSQRWWQGHQPQVGVSPAASAILGKNWPKMTILTLRTSLPSLPQMAVNAVFWPGAVQPPQTKIGLYLGLCGSKSTRKPPHLSSTQASNKQYFSYPSAIRFVNHSAIGGVSAPHACRALLLRRIFPERPRLSPPPKTAPMDWAVGCVFNRCSNSWNIKM